MNDIEKEVNELTIDALCLGTGFEIKPEHDIIEDLGADDLDEVELCMAVEEQFGIAISEEDWGKIKTVQDIYDYVDYRLNGGTKWPK